MGSKVKYGRIKKMLDIKIEKTTNPKPIPGPEDPLVIGTIFTDHMYEPQYCPQKR